MEVRTLPLTPPNGAQKANLSFVCMNKIQIQSNKVCYKVFFVRKLPAAELLQNHSPIQQCIDAGGKRNSST